MKLDEASRQYQAVLEAYRAALPFADLDDVEVMDQELQNAKKALEVAYLNSLAD